MWKDAHTESVDKLKSAVMNAALLAHPDYKKPFILYTDASTVGLGAALHQEQDDGLEAPLAYYSKKLVGAARRYPPIELEANAFFLDWKSADHLHVDVLSLLRRTIVRCSI